MPVEEAVVEPTIDEDDGTIEEALLVKKASPFNKRVIVNVIV